MATATAVAHPEPAYARLTRRRHTAIVLVSVVDRRILPALRFVSRLPDTDVRAVHIASDSTESRQLAEDWMGLGLTWLPLHIHDVAASTFLESFRVAIREEAGYTVEVTVVVPELDYERWWQPMLHRRTARRIAQELQALPGVTPVIVPFTAST